MPVGRENTEAWSGDAPLGGRDQQGPPSLERRHQSWARARPRLSGLDKVLIALEVFLAAGAIPAGILMVIRPSGDLMRMPLSMLDGSPFKDLLWPWA